jgi:peptide methionine sulfoxide reductase MsrA
MSSVAINKAEPEAKSVEVAVLAGGCFWGVEDILRDVPGVIDTEVGYIGGHVENPRSEDMHYP